MKVTDANGVIYETKEMDPGDVLMLLEAAGDASGNMGYVRFAMVMASVTSINGIPVPHPTKKQDLVTIARKIGNVGLAALQAAMFGPDAAAEAPGSVEASKN